MNTESDDKLIEEISTLKLIIANQQLLKEEEADAFKNVSTLASDVFVFLGVIGVYAASFKLVVKVADFLTQKPKNSEEEDE